MIVIALSIALSACVENRGAPLSLAMQESLPISARTDLKDNEKAAMANVELGLGYLSQGQVARAKGKLTHALKLGPEIAEVHSAMAYFWERVGDFKDAEREHQLALKLGKGHGAELNNYGAFLCRQGRLQEASLAFDEALADKSYTRTAEVYENAGLCALKLPDKAKAQTYLSKALKQDPRRTQALLELSNLYLSLKKPEEAKSLLEQFQRISEPTAKSAWLGLEVAKSLQDEIGMEKNRALLKNLFQDSPEYQRLSAKERT